MYHPDRPLEKRDMLLEVRFWGLRFHVGVRVGGVPLETTAARLPDQLLDWVAMESCRRRGGVVGEPR